MPQGSWHNVHVVDTLLCLWRDRVSAAQRFEFRQNKLGDGGAGNILFSICASVAMSSVLTIHCYVNVALLIIFYYHDQFCQLSNAAIFYINYKSLFSYPCTQQFLQYNRCLSYCSFHFYHQWWYSIMCQIHCIIITYAVINRRLSCIISSNALMYFIYFTICLCLYKYCQVSWLYQSSK